MKRPYLESMRIPLYNNSMGIVTLVFRMIGGLCMFLLGMKIMSDGIQQSAGDRMRKTLNFMTGNRFAGVLTGFSLTALIQSSSAATVMVVSFVNAGLLTLTQSVGVIMGANIGTTVTAWIVSLVGYSLQISSLALPAVGIGFILSVIKWKHKSVGSIIMGFGLLFLGLYFMTQEMNSLYNEESFTAISVFKDKKFLAVIIGVGAGFLMTILIHSSSATSAIVLTMAFKGIISYEMGGGMILGASIGTTIDAVLASIGANTAAKRTALVHVLFNVIGTCWALIFIEQMLGLVDSMMPGDPREKVLLTNGEEGFIAATTHLAMFQTVYKIVNTILFFPFVNHYARLICFIIREKPEEKSRLYKFAYISSAKTSTPELNILRAEKEIRDMAGIVSAMYARFSTLLRELHESKDREDLVAKFCDDMKQKEDYVDQMRETLTAFLIECTRTRLNPHSERRVSRLLRVTGDIEDMSDECYGISRLLEKSVRKKRVFKKDEMDELVPYVQQVEEFLDLLNEKLGQSLTLKSTMQTKKLEADIGKSRKQLQKLSRKRIEAGKDVQTELLFIDLVRRIERLGDYCMNITEKISN